MPTTLFVLFDAEIDWINQKIILDSSIMQNDNCPVLVCQNLFGLFGESKLQN